MATCQTTLTLCSRHNRAMVYRQRYSNKWGEQLLSQVLEHVSNVTTPDTMSGILPHTLVSEYGTQFPSHGMG